MSMSNTPSTPSGASPASPTCVLPRSVSRPAWAVLGAISLSHLLHDMLQVMLIALYPMWKLQFDLSFSQIGLLAFVYQCTSSLLQPPIGAYTDRHPWFYLLPCALVFVGLGLLVLSFAPNLYWVMLASACSGIGSAIFHTESSRVARLASGGRHGLAQSVFQVGGNLGSALGPLAAGFLVIPHGQQSLSWFAVVAIFALCVLLGVARWTVLHHHSARGRHTLAATASPYPRRVVNRTIALLLMLVFTKYFYLASFFSYYTLYLIDRFALALPDAQFHLFVFLFAVALGTLVGGPLGDRIGRRQVIGFSIIGAAPFALALPYADLFWTTALSFLVGLILSSAFSVIIVYAQELLPGRTGLVAGFFFGFAFGVGALGAAALGWLADHLGLVMVYQLCAFLPLLGLVATALPDLRQKHAPATADTGNTPAAPPVPQR